MKDGLYIQLNYTPPASHPKAAGSSCDAGPNTTTITYNSAWIYVAEKSLACKEGLLLTSKTFNPQPQMCAKPRHVHLQSPHQPRPLVGKSQAVVWLVAA